MRVEPNIKSLDKVTAYIQQQESDVIASRGATQDNKVNQVKAWAETPYTFIKRQSAQNPLVWISLLPPDITPLPAVSASNY